MPPRTKACAICRQKRIKCDATLPECLMCVRTNKKCPGISDGPLIIDMTTSAALRTNKKKAKSPPRAEAPLPEDLMTALTTYGHQPSQRAMLNEAFYAQFLSFFTSTGEGKQLKNKYTWLHLLPQLASDGTSNALSLALYATSTAFVGVEAKNTSAVQEAAKLYGQALSLHSREIKSKRQDVNVHMISTSILFSIFEAVRATTADAYRSHIQGAAKMMEVTGPGRCVDGVLCQLFFHIRTQMAFIYLTTKKPTPVHVKKILTETLLYRKFPMFQRLMSHVAVLAEIYVGKTSPSSAQQLIDLPVYSTAKSDIHALWTEYQSEAEVKKSPISFPDPTTGKTMYRDGFTALTVAYFAAARILYSILAPRLALSYVDLTDYYQVVLESTRFLDAKNIGCAYMRMATPLYLVALHAPKVEQRQEAIAMFESWNQGSMSGISQLALHAIHEAQGLDDGVQQKEQQEATPEMIPAPTSLPQQNPVLPSLAPPTEEAMNLERTPFRLDDFLGPAELHQQWSTVDLNADLAADLIAAEWPLDAGENSIWIQREHNRSPAEVSF